MGWNLFERPRHGERALLVDVQFGPRRGDGAIEEFHALAVSAGADPLATISAQRNRADPRYCVGSGKVEEIRLQVEEHKVEIVLFSRPLSASQERNLEKVLGCRVLDRTGLILDIFAQRARSFEGKLQVELAQLKHLSSRLVRGWTHLERQKGGIGLRGPGETQLETDRRLIAQRIRSLEDKLDKVAQQRDQNRRSRQKAAVPTVSLVGYTNAGKSTLFNRMTVADVYAADQLFATLDPTVRRLALPGLGHVVLADTVGFVRDLPHDLIAAFRSTLLETREADLLLHVIDANDELCDLYIDKVNEVLREIGAADVPQLLVYNKIDLSGQPPMCVADPDGRPRAAYVSAQTGAGLSELQQAIVNCFAGELIRGWIRLKPEAAKQRAQLYEAGAVLSEQAQNDGDSLLHVCLRKDHLHQMGLAIDQITDQAGDQLSDQVTQ
ncbi:MAG: GTPase HflX [Gammaproteobacteria bacterium]|nr:GTPase HflX [Gammaproteobacteria bacterium]